MRRLALIVFGALSLSAQQAPPAQQPPATNNTTQTAQQPGDPADSIPPDTQAPPSAKDAQPAATADAGAPVETFTARAREVNVIFTVTDKRGKFIRDLKRDDFKVTDNKEHVPEIRSFATETDLPLRVGLLIDASNSIRDQFKFEQEAAIIFLNDIVRPKTDLSFVLGFDTTPEVTQDWTNSEEKLASGVRFIRPGGGTALYDAVYFACRDKLLKRQDNTPVRKAIILLSDGDDNQSRVTLQETIEMAQRAEVIVYTISTNFAPNEDKGDRVLKRLAEETGGRTFHPGRVENVSNAFRDIQDELRSQYVLAYRPPSLITDGTFHEIGIEVPNNKKLKVRARRGYYAPKPQ